LGGKGVQFAKVLNYFCKGQVILAQFIGGYTGEYIEKTLQEMGVRQVNVKTASATRMCTTLLCRHAQKVTEIIDPSESVLAEEVIQLENQIYAVLPEVAGIALCGTYPPGVPKEFYVNIINRKSNSTLVLLEGSESSLLPGIREVLKTRKVDILKIKEKELGILTNTNTITEGVQVLQDEYSIQCVLVSEGFDKENNTEHLFLGLYDHYEFKYPNLPDKHKENYRNQVGYGDTVAAVFFSMLLETNDFVIAFRFGLAAGYAMEAENFSLEEASKIYQDIIVNQWT